MRPMVILFKLVKLYLILWVLYLFLSSRVDEFNVTSFESKLLLNKSRNSIKSVNLIIAHPDDEVMFFAPTLLQLDSMVPKDVPFNVICLSKGIDVDGSFIGDVRSNELGDSLAMLLQHKRKGQNRDVKLHQFDYLDGMNQEWDLFDIVNDIEDVLLLKKDSTENESNKNEKNLILTFDSKGVSNHPNHISCHDAVVLLRNKHIGSDKFSFLILNSYGSNIFIKYSSFIASEIKLLLNMVNTKFNIVDTGKLFFNDDSQRHIQFINSFEQYVLAFASMVNSHKSQMVWFRYGWWSFARFVFVNDLDIIDL